MLSLAMWVRKIQPIRVNLIKPPQNLKDEGKPAAGQRCIKRWHKSDNVRHETTFLMQLQGVKSINLTNRLAYLQIEFDKSFHQQG